MTKIMKFNNLPKKYELILNRFCEKGETFYEFECWEQGFPSITIFKAKTKTASEITKKINKFVKSL